MFIVRNDKILVSQLETFSRAKKKMGLISIWQRIKEELNEIKNDPSVML